MFSENAFIPIGQTDHLTGATVMCKAGATVMCNPVPPRMVIRNTFSLAALSEATSNEDTASIVHRGESFPLPGFEPVLTCTELVLVFAQGSDGSRDLASPQLIGLLKAESSERTRKEVGWATRILCHQARLNRMTLGFGLGVTLDQEHLDAAVEFLPDYAALATAITQTEGSIAIGLRGQSADVRGLQAITVDGISPYSEEARSRYPFRYQSTLYVRNGLPSETASMVSKFVSEIGIRISQDKLLLDRPRKSDALSHGVAV